MCAIHLPLLSVGGKGAHESTKYSIYTTTEKALVKYDGYLPKILQFFFSLQQFFSFSMFISITFVKRFAWYNVLLKFDVKKFFVNICIFPTKFRIAQSNQNI